MTYSPIEDHGLIGDLNTVALVGIDGAIDFMCFPAFDSPTVFAALLDQGKGGEFKIAPTFENVRRKQLYLPDTNILLSRFLSSEGVAEISDFMPIPERGGGCHIVRRAKTVRGEVSYRMTCEPRFDYARTTHRVEARDGEVLFVPESGEIPPLRLRASVPVRVEHGAAVAEFRLRTGDTASFVLEQVMPRGESPTSSANYVSESFKGTVNYWRNWIGKCSYDGRWREVVYRSALVLKLLTAAKYGSIVAAATFGLPEEIGGERNWDYRFSWIRDASFTLYGLIRLGFTEEARAFMAWLEARTETLKAEGPLQIVYGIDGRQWLDEITLDHLEGYRGSKPVRIGNAAHNQLQLDIYGEMMDSVYLYDKYGEIISHDLWRSLTRVVEWVAENWQQPDEGIWEVRSGRYDFLASRLMCWVALDRAVRLATKRSLPAPLDRWRQVRDRIHEDIYTHFWDPHRAAFVQHKKTNRMDAATLLMPLVRFISPTDRRWLSTLRAIEEELVEDSLVYRYRIGEAAEDGLSGSEGTFNICSFWYVESLSRAGELQKARLAFEKILGYANHLGLYAEQLGPYGEHLGNFPQAFTHLALISAAYDLNRRLDAAGWRA